MQAEHGNTWSGRAHVVAGAPAFLFGGEIHYFRIPRTRWHDVARKARAAFLNTVGSYIPWNLHEPEEGVFDFNGDIDLAEWIRTLDDTGLWFFARPGPYICSEWDMGGLPAWLIDSTTSVRTSDPAYLAKAGNWLTAVDGILTGFLPEQNGNLICYQIENELIWGELDYMLDLQRRVLADGITVPLITNLNPAVRRATTIIDTLDLYPGPWNLHKPEEAIRELIENQTGKPPACVEFQMGFAAEAGSTLPTMVGPIEPSWVEVHVKSAIARGLNFINFYMFAGGTTTGYRTGRRDISSYDYESAIREWGLPGEKYYVTRRIGGFLDSFGDRLVLTHPDGTLPVDSPRGVTVPVRRGEVSSFIFPRNTTMDACDITLDTVPFTGGDGTGPITVHLPARAMKMLPCAVPLDGGKELVFSTSEVFTSFRYGDEVCLLLHGEPGEPGVIILDGCDGLEQAGGDACTDISGGRLTVRFSHHRGIGHLLFRSSAPTEHGFQDSLRIIVTDTETASRTWVGQWGGGRFPMLSDIPFMDVEEADSRRCVMSVERGAGPAFIEFPCLGRSARPPAVTHDGGPVDMVYDAAAGTVRLELPSLDEPPGGSIELTDWLMRTPDPLAASSSADWRPYPSIRGNERAGIHGSGYFSYRTTFTWEGPADGVKLELSELHDNASVWLNGTFLGGVIATDTHGARFSCDIGRCIRKGENDLFILLESEGRPRKGDEATVSGLTGPVIVTRGKASSLALESWRRKTLRFDSESSMNEPPAESGPAHDDSVWETVTVRPGIDSRVIMPPSTVHIEPGYERLYVVYRTDFTIGSSRAGQGVYLDVGKADGKAWIYCNGVEVDKKHQERFTTDLTNHVTEGRNMLVIVLRNFRWYTTIGLHGLVSLRFADRILADGWEILEGAPGMSNGRPPSRSGPGWTEAAPCPSHSPVIFSATFRHEPPSGWMTPVGLRLNGWNAKIQVWLNGVLVGRHHPDGPQEMFCLPEDLLERDNHITLVCNAFDGMVMPGSATVERYDAIHKERIEISF